MRELRATLEKRYDLSRESERKRSVRDTVDLMHALAAVIQPKLTLEVGAFEAAFSARCVRDYPGARVIALEANPHNYAHFSPGMTPGVEYLHLAATHEDGPVTFRVQTRRRGRDRTLVGGDNSLMARDQPNVEYEEVTVAGRSLDSLLAELELTGVPSIMWVDVEGAQREVIAGGQSTFRHAQVVLIEVETKRLWQSQMLEFEVNEHLTYCGLVPVYMDFEYTGQHNILYLNQALVEDPDIIGTLNTFLGRAT